MANKVDHKSCVLTQICIAYNLILTCRWYLKFDINVFSNIKANVAILHYKADIAYTCCHFEVLMKNKKKRQFQSVLNLA